MSLALLFASQGGGTSAGDMRVATPAGNSGVPVTAGAIYGAVASFRARTTTRSCRVLLRWYDSGGTLLSTAVGLVTTNSNVAWTTTSVVDMAPTGAHYVAVVTEVLAADANEEHYVDKIGLTLLTVANMLTPNQASLETDLTGWLDRSNSTRVRSTAQAADGIASLALAPTTTGTGSATTTGGVSAVPVVLGNTYTALISVRAATTPRTINLFIQWWKIDGSGNGTSTVAGVVDTISGWTASHVTEAAPANTAFASISVEVVSGVAGEVHYVDKIALIPGAGTTWVIPTIPAWSIYGPGNTTFTIEFSDDGELTWHELTSGIEADVNQQALWQDRFATFNAERSYRAYSVGDV